MSTVAADQAPEQARAAGRFNAASWATLALALLVVTASAALLRYRLAQPEDGYTLQVDPFGPPLRDDVPVGGVMEWVWSLGPLAIAAPPLCIAAAILRYRLFAIDVVLSRTLVYGALTLCLAAAYGIVAGALGLLVGAQSWPCPRGSRPCRPPSSWQPTASSRRH